MAMTGVSQEGAAPALPLLSIEALDVQFDLPGAKATLKAVDSVSFQIGARSSV